MGDSFDNLDNLDRWYLGEGSFASYYWEGLQLGGDLKQLVYDIDSLSGKHITIAVGDKDGNIVTASAVFDESDGTVCAASHPVSNYLDVYIAYDLDLGCLTFCIHSQYDAIISWAALYIGEYTAETLPEYQPKGYAAELLECKRYFRKYGPHTILATGRVTTIGVVEFSLPLSTPFRFTPTASEATFEWMVDVEYGSFTATPWVERMGASEIFLRFSLDEVDFSDYRDKQITLVLDLSEFTLTAE